jgi:hypothetical protein
VLGLAEFLWHFAHLLVRKFASVKQRRQSCPPVWIFRNFAHFYQNRVLQSWLKCYQLVPGGTQIVIVVDEIDQNVTSWVQERQIWIMVKKNGANFGLLLTKWIWDPGDKRKTVVPGWESIDLSTSYINFLNHDNQFIPVSLTTMSLIKWIMPLPFLSLSQLVSELFSSRCSCCTDTRAQREIKPKSDRSSLSRKPTEKKVLKGRFRFFRF